MQLYKYRPWNEFAEQILIERLIFYPSKANLNDLAELIHPIKFESNSHEIFRAKSNQANGDGHKAALILSSNISDRLKKLEKSGEEILNSSPYKKYLNIENLYQRIVEATYDEINNIHDAFFYYAVNQLEDAKSLYCTNDEAIKRLNKKLSNIGILSLSAKNDCPVMWAHYASNHSGVVFIFDNTKDELFKNSTDVEYVDERKEISLDNIPGIFYKKANAWAYEEEHRILVKNGDSCYPFNKETLVGIILGIKMETNTRRRVLSIVKNNNLKIDIYQAQTSLNSFKIQYSKIAI